MLASRAARAALVVGLWMLASEVRAHDAWLLRRALRAPADCDDGGRGARCRPLPHGLVADLKLLAPPPARAPGRELAPQRRCQRAIHRAVIELASAGRTRRPRPSRALTRVERWCDVEVRETRSGQALPSVGAACAPLTAVPGSRVDAPGLATCLRTVVGSWLRLHRGEPLRPNVIVVLADDQRHDSLDGMPALLERIAARGVTFSNAYVAAPICGPSRASLLTGRYVWRHRLFKNKRGELFEDADTLARWLSDAGYRTAFYGKYVNKYERRWTTGSGARVPDGWDDFRAFLPAKHDVIDPFGFEMGINGFRVRIESWYATDLLAAQALAWVDRAADDPRPFFLLVSPQSPHAPHEPAPRHAGVLSDTPPFRPASYFEADVSDKPLWVRRLDPFHLVFDHWAQQLRRTQLEMQLSIDELVAALDERLGELGIAEETALIYTSDNGQGWGEHRWQGKACPWEECVRVPLLVRYPPLAPTARVEPGLAVNVDLAPTIAALAGVAGAGPDGFDGRSLLRALDGTERAPREDFLFESYTGSEEPRHFVGVHTGDAKLVLHRTGELELYDLLADPDELDNRSGDPAYAEIETALGARLFELWPGPHGTPFMDPPEPPPPSVP